jgi:cell division protein FtsN
MSRILVLIFFATVWVAAVHAQIQEGMGTWYETDSRRLTASHAVFPLGTRVRVINLQNDKQVIVTIDNRIEDSPDRLIDISKAAADNLGMYPEGPTPVRLEVLSRNAAPLAVSSPSTSTSTETSQGVSPETRSLPEIRPPPEPPMDTPAQAPANDEPTTHDAAPAKQTPASADSTIYNHIIITIDGVPAASDEASANPMPPYSEAVPVRIIPRRPDPSAYAIYRVQVGAFLEERNAINAYTRLTTAGFSPGVEWYNGYWRVFLPGIGAVEIDDIVRRLGAAGFSEALLREEF